MNRFSILVLCCLILVLTGLTGCKSISNITAKDTGKERKPTARRSDKLVFLEDIEVVPGSVVQSRHKPKTTRQTKTNIPVPSQFLVPDTSVKGDIEHFNQMQFKYSIIMDATVEYLSNVKLFEKVESWWGTPYCMGGSTRDCIDCSSFTQAMVRDVYKAELPRTAQEQYDACQRINYEDLKEGDLVFFRNGRRGGVTHVGLYLANNKFVHASTSSGVTISDLNESFWRYHWHGAGRIVITAK